MFPSNGVTDVAAVCSELVRLPGGRFRMGSDRFYPEEAPVREVEVASFAIARAPVTNRQFAAFVQDTDYVTGAEQPLDPANFPGVERVRLKPGALVFHPLRAVPATYDWRLWWRYKPGACWRRPEAGASVFAGRVDHPVVCVNHADAEAYAAWAGLRLPTEAEWEFAARGGRDGVDYAWGDEFVPRGGRMANTWEGTFPVATDRGRAVRTTRIGSFAKNNWGLQDMIGNVWEWTSDLYRDSSADACCGGELAEISFVVKGGSFLCAPAYCARYRPAARQPQAADTATGHIGFRCAVD